MANQAKKAYVDDLRTQLQNNPHLVVVGFSGIPHKQMEEFRTKLRESSDNPPSFVVLKNSLFKIAFDGFNRKNKVVSDGESLDVQNSVKGQSALMLMNEDWLSGLKTVKEFAKDIEGFEFKIGIIDGQVYADTGLKQLADLPGKEELIAKIIGALKAPQSRFVYGLNFNTMKLVNVLKNASESKQ